MRRLRGPSDVHRRNLTTTGSFRAEISGRCEVITNHPLRGLSLNLRVSYAMVPLNVNVSYAMVTLNVGVSYALA